MDKKRKRANIKQDAFFKFDEDIPDQDNLETTSDGEIEVKKHKNVENVDDDKFKNETAEERRLRLAKEYLSQLENLKGESDAAEMDREIVAARLHDDHSETQGKLQRKLADQINKTVDPNSIRKMRGHQLSVTSMALSSDDRTLYTSSKDCTIIKWDVATGKKIFQFPGARKPQKGVEGHVGYVLAIALSSDGKYLASGGKDNLIRIWDTKEHKLIDSFKGHRDIITSMAFRVGTHQLFTGSNDRTIKIWDVAEMTYVDTLYGHQAEIMAIDALKRERAISSSRDKSVHVWKVVEETQLLFKQHTASVDCVAMFNEEYFVSGSEDGSIALWSSQKKKALAVVKHAHSDESDEQPNWISSIATLRYSDLFATGSCDGFIRLWKADTSKPTITSVLTIPMPGFINSLTFAHSGKFLIAGIGQEHRLGRWETIKEARNGVRIIPL